MTEQSGPIDISPEAIAKRLVEEKRMAEEVRIKMQQMRASQDNHLHGVASEREKNRHLTPKSTIIK